MLAILTTFFQFAQAGKIKVIVDGACYTFSYSDDFTENLPEINYESCFCYQCGAFLDTGYVDPKRRPEDFLCACDPAYSHTDSETDLIQKISVADITCDLCHEKVEFIGLESHVKVVHRDDNALITPGHNAHVLSCSNVCPECSVMCDSQNSMLIHRDLFHTESELNDCPWCDASCGTGTCLVNHTHKHHMSLIVELMKTDSLTTLYEKEKRVYYLTTIRNDEDNRKARGLLQSIDELAAQFSSLELENKQLKTSLRILEDKLAQDKSLFVWEVSPSVVANNPVYSDPFYRPCPSGYKMRLVFYPQGGKNSKELFIRYASLYLQIMPGDHDDKLQWPLACYVNFTVCHPSGILEKNIVKKIFCAPVKNGPAGLKKPTNGKVNPGFGCTRLCPCTTLKPGKGFVENGKLTIVCEVVL